MTLVQLVPQRGSTPTMDPAAALAAVDELLVFARNRVAKATLPASVKARDALIDESAVPFVEDLAGYFERLANIVELRAGAVGKAVEPIWNPDGLDWDAEDAALRKVVFRWWVTVGAAGYDEAMETLVLEGRWDLNARGVKRVLARIADRVKGINDASRVLIRDMVDAASERGYSVAEFVRGVEADGFRGLRDLVLSWGSPTGRAATIAQTELAAAWNLSSLQGYRDSGIVDQVHVFDGTKDEGCAAANGAQWTLREAEANPLQHPRCQRAFAPVAAR